MTHASVAHKLVSDLRFNLILFHAGLHKVQNTLKGICSVLNRFFDQRNFYLLLDLPQVHHDLRGAVITMQWILMNKLVHEALIAIINPWNEAIIFIEVEINIISVNH